MQPIPATNIPTEDEQRSNEVNIVAPPTENGVLNAEENGINVATLAQAPEPQQNQVRNELEQFVSCYFVHLVRGKIIYGHITMQVEPQSQITTDKEYVPPILKERPNNISKSLFNNDKSAKTAVRAKYITSQQLQLSGAQTRSSKKR